MKNIFLKKAMIFLLALISAVGSFSQDSSIEKQKVNGILFGLSVGLNASTRSYDYQINPTPPFGSFRLAPSGGILLGYQFSKSFAIQTLWKYQGKGDKINVANWLTEFETPETVNAVWEIEPNGNITTSLHYAEISLLPVFGLGNFKDGLQVQFGAGGFAAFGLGGTEIHDYRFTYYLDYELDSEEVIYEKKQVEFVTLLPSTFGEEYVYLNSFDYGILSYAGLRFKKINVGLYLSWGLEQLEYNSFNFGYWTQPKDVSKTVTSTLAFNYIF